MITDKGNMVSLKGNEAIRIRMWADGESTPYVDDWLDEPWENGYPILIMTSRMLSKVGKVKYEFVIQEPGSPAVISTRQQNLLIQKSLINYDGLIASEDFDVLSDLIAQAITIPDLINDINVSLDDVSNKISEVNSTMAEYEQQMQFYAAEYSEMKNDMRDVIYALHIYMDNVENAAANSARLSESWAIGGTNYREDENTNNSKYHSNQSKLYSDASAASADRAEQFAGNVDPKTLNQVNAIDSNGLLGTPGSVIPSQHLVDEISTNVKNINVSMYEVNSQMFTKATKGQIVSSDLQNVTDSDRIGLSNLKEEVIQAMAGNTSVNSIPANNSVTPSKTSFLKSLNLFDGNYYHGYYLSGTGNKFIAKNSDYYMLVLNVEPNTTYSYNKPFDVGLEDGLYWYKMVTSTISNYKSILETVDGGTTVTLDGAISQSNTSTNTTNRTFTTGTNDHSIFIMVTKYQQPYVEFLNGTYIAPLYSSYAEGFKPFGIDVYSKNEVDNTFNAMNGYINAKNEKLKLLTNEDGSYIIFYKSKSGKYIGYKYGNYIVGGSVNTNVWRLINTWVYSDSLTPMYEICNDDYDMEGVLKISTQSDYIGSVHGDEQQTAIYMFLNGIRANYATPHNGYYDSVSFIVASDIYNQETLTRAFKKVKQITFDNTGVHINSKWVADTEVTLTHVRGCLMSINKYSGATKLISLYYDSEVNLNPSAVPEVGKTNVLFTNNRLIDSIFTGDIVYARLWTGKRGDTNYSTSCITDFNTRLKAYIDCYAGATVEAGEEITCQSNFYIGTI